LLDKTLFENSSLVATVFKIKHLSSWFKVPTLNLNFSDQGSYPDLSLFSTPPFIPLQNYLGPGWEPCSNTEKLQHPAVHG